MRKRNVGLALGSGGLRGYAHIGVLKCLTEHNVPIDLVVGASAGGLVGAMYCSGKTIDEIEKFWLDLDVFKILKLISKFNFQAGLLKNKKAIAHVIKFIGEQNIINLKPKFAVLATDLISGHTAIFDRGSLEQALEATSAVPFLFRPVNIGNALYIDGGASQPVPVDAARKLGADFVIGVNLDSCFFPSSITHNRMPSMSKVMRGALDSFRYYLAKANVKEADIIIEPQIESVTFNIAKISNAVQYINEGYNSTLKQLPKILRGLEAF